MVYSEITFGFGRVSGEYEDTLVLHVGLRCAYRKGTSPTCLKETGVLHVKLARFNTAKPQSEIAS